MGFPMSVADRLVAYLRVMQCGSPGFSWRHLSRLSVAECEAFAERNADVWAKTGEMA
jgi:hypothetical protein